MTTKQKKQYNKMLATLKRIYREYYTSEQLHRSAQRLYGCSGDDAIEMSYDNIQTEAENCIKGVRAIK